MNDPDYIPPSMDPPLPTAKRKPPSPSLSKPRKSKATTLQQAWPEIKQLCQKGLSPSEIRDLVNAKRPPSAHLTNKQISDLITRKKKEGQFKLSVSESGALTATNSDGTIRLRV